MAVERPNRVSSSAYLVLKFLASVYVLQFISVSSGFFIDQHQSPSVHDWSYQDQQDWQNLHRQCGKRTQSPIDIQRRRVIHNAQLKLLFYNYEQSIKFKIQNAHHTIKLSPLEAHERFQLDGQGSRLQNNDHSASGSDSSSSDDIAPFGEDVELVIDGTQHNNQLNSSDEQEQRHRGLGGSRTPSRLEPRNNSVTVSNSGSSISNHHHEQETADTNESAPYNGVPSIKLDWLDDGNNEYKLRDIHFHWGERKDNGSEHAIDGRRAAMEMHLVHIKHGLDKAKIGFTTDSVAVIAVLIESYRKSNADFNPIVNALNHINSTDRTMEIEYKAITDLLPNTLTSFYTYSGSLTTPPCYQVVNWIVMAERLYLNAKQIEMFRNLYSPEETSSGLHSEPDLSSQPTTNPELKLMMPNVRHIQPLNNRTILASFTPLSRLEQIQVANSPNDYNSATNSIHIHIPSLSLIGSLILAAILMRQEPIVLRA